MISKMVNLSYNINIPTSNRSLNRLIDKCAKLYQDFEIDSKDVDFLGGYALNLFAKDGLGSVRVYFEGLEYAIKDWCTCTWMVVPFLHGHDIFLDELTSSIADFIMDTAMMHSLEVEGKV